MQSDAQPWCISFVSSTSLLLIILTSDVRTSPRTSSLLPIKLAFEYTQLGDVESICAVTCAHQTRDPVAVYGTGPLTPFSGLLGALENVRETLEKNDEGPLLIQINVRFALRLVLWLS